MSHAIALIDRLVLSDLVPFRLISLANTTPIEIYILSLHDALPISAQYGFRTAGIIDIQTKTGTIDPGGSVSMYGGSHGWIQPSRSEEHTSELQSHLNLVCRLLLEKKQIRRRSSNSCGTYTSPT